MTLLKTAFKVWWEAPGMPPFWKALIIGYVAQEYQNQHILLGLTELYDVTKSDHENFHDPED